MHAAVGRSVTAPIFFSSGAAPLDPARAHGFQRLRAGAQNSERNLVHTDPSLGTHHATQRQGEGPEACAGYTHDQWHVSYLPKLLSDTQVQGAQQAGLRALPATDLGNQMTSRLSISLMHRTQVTLEVDAVCNAGVRGPMCETETIGTRFFRDNFCAQVQVSTVTRYCPMALFIISVSIIATARQHVDSDARDSVR